MSLSLHSFPFTDGFCLHFISPSCSPSNIPLVWPQLFFLRARMRAHTHTHTQTLSVSFSFPFSPHELMLFCKPFVRMDHHEEYTGQPATCRPHKDGAIPLNVLPEDATNKLNCWFFYHTIPFVPSVSNR